MVEKTGREELKKEIKQEMKEELRSEIKKELKQEIGTGDRKVEKSDDMSRRNFLKKLGAGAAGIGALSLSPAASQLRLTKNGVFQGGDTLVSSSGTSTDFSSNLNINGNIVDNVDTLGSGVGPSINLRAGTENRIQLNTGGNNRIRFQDTTNSRVLMDLVEGGNVELNTDLTDGTNTIFDYTNSWIPTSTLENNSVTIAGNSVSLGSSTAINHSDLSNLSTDDHHTRYTDSEAVNAVEGQSSLSVDISGDADTLDGNHASDLGGVSPGPTKSWKSGVSTDTWIKNDTGSPLLVIMVFETSTSSSQTVSYDLGVTQDGSGSTVIRGPKFNSRDGETDSHLVTFMVDAGHYFRLDENGDSVYPNAYYQKL